MDMQIEGDLP